MKIFRLLLFIYLLICLFFAEHVWATTSVTVKNLKAMMKCGKVKHEFRVQIHELGVQIYELRVQIHESRVQIHELRVQIQELRVQIQELRVQIYELGVQIHKLEH